MLCASLTIFTSWERNHFPATGLARLVHAGLADPVYAEAYVTVHQYDIVLDVTVINRTSDTLQARQRPFPTASTRVLCKLADLQAPMRRECTVKSGSEHAGAWCCRPTPEAFQTHGR